MTKKNEIVKTGTDTLAGFDLAQRVAKAYSSSSLIPEVFRSNIPNCMIAMELSQRTGTGILAVMQNLYIVHGKPSWSSSYLIATVNTCGRFSPLRFKFQGAEGDDNWGCRAYATDKETGEICTGSLITIGMAKVENWYSKKGSKWQTMPEQMLQYRAAAFWIRLFAPELSMGMQTKDEVQDVHYVESKIIDQKIEQDAIDFAEKDKAKFKKQDEEIENKVDERFKNLGDNSDFEKTEAEKEAELNAELDRLAKEDESK